MVLGPGHAGRRPTGKIDADKDEIRALRIGPQIRAMIDQAQQDVRLISPYFIPGDEGTRYLTDLTGRGVKVKVLTNSLASTDEAAVHAGYSRYRRTLLEGGVQLYELRPAAGVEQPATSKGTSSGVSLHAKAIVVDGKLVFIGSMNMDQRSKLLNTEMGIIVDCPALAIGGDEFLRHRHPAQQLLPCDAERTARRAHAMAGQRKRQAGDLPP
jgi:Phosphatidylserine/phosphatidylglycerophosphate/cardiolipin synthases and related enzymes